MLFSVMSQCENQLNAFIEATLVWLSKVDEINVCVSYSYASDIDYMTQLIDVHTSNTQTILCNTELSVVRPSLE